MKKIKIIIISILLILISCNSEKQKEKTFPRLATQTFNFNKATFTDNASGVSKTRNTNFTVQIDGNSLDAITKGDTTKMRFKGTITDVRIDGTKYIMLETDTEEDIMIPMHKKFIVFTSKKYTTKLFNNK